MKAFIYGVAAVAAISASAHAAWGLQFEVSSDGANWGTSIAANQGDVVRFRVGSYFDIGTKITTADGTGNALMLRRFTGQNRVDGLGANDAIQNLVRTVNNGNPALLQVSGNLIGTTTSSSFGQIFFLDPLPALPVMYSEIYKGEIVIGSGNLRSMTLMNNSYGTTLIAGLVFYHDASRTNKQSAAPSDPVTRTDLNATINVVPAPASVPLLAFALFGAGRRRR